MTIHKRNEPNLARGERGKEIKIESYYILHPPKTYCLNMATSDFFPQNVTTLVHFSQDSFCMLCIEFWLCQKGKKKSIGCTIWM